MYNFRSIFTSNLLSSCPSAEDFNGNPEAKPKKKRIIPDFFLSLRRPFARRTHPAVIWAEIRKEILQFTLSLIHPGGEHSLLVYRVTT